MGSSTYRERLRVVPAFSDCSTAELDELARLVDLIGIPAGSPVPTRPGDLVVTTHAIRLLVVDRRAVRRVLELAPGLAEPDGARPAAAAPRRSATVRWSTPFLDASGPTLAATLTASPGHATR